MSRRTVSPPKLAHRAPTGQRERFRKPAEAQFAVDAALVPRDHYLYGREIAEMSRCASRLEVTLHGRQQPMLQQAICCNADLSKWHPGPFGDLEKRVLPV